MENIKEKVVVITGASSGLGEATARFLAAKGASVVLGARRAERLKSLADELIRDGGKVLAVATDVTDREQVKRLVDTAVQEFGRIDVLLNNAGLMPLSPLERLKVDEWDRMIDVNLKGVLYGIAAALPHMQRQESGHIINVSSAYGHRVGPTAAVYSATKFAVRALSEGLRQEVKPHNIRTTVISPGAVVSELREHISEKDVAESVKELVSEIAMPTDSFARMVAFAISQPEEVDVNEILFRSTRQPLKLRTSKSRMNINGFAGWRRGGRVAITLIASRALMLILAFAVSQDLGQAAERTNTNRGTTQMRIKIGSSNFVATLDDNPTATAFKALLPLTVDMQELNGNEKLYRLSNKLPTKASNPGKIENGDLMLYGASTVVLFYKSFPTSYSYTRLGRINEPTGLALAVGTGSVKVTFELAAKPE